MFDQPNDFRGESDALYELIKDLPEERLLEPTQFKGWTINDVIGHLHMFNVAARYALEDEAKFIDLPNSPLWFGEENVVVGD